LHRTASFDVFCVDVRGGVLAVGDFLNPRKIAESTMVCEVAHARKRNPLSDLNKILHVVDIPDIITSANFGEDRLRGLGMARGQICHSPLTLIVALTTLARYTRTTVRVCDTKKSSEFLDTV